MSARKNVRTCAAGLLALVLAAVPVASRAQDADGETPTWIAAWGAAINGTGSAIPDGTVRNIARVSTGGQAVRIRLSNAVSKEVPLLVGGASIALQAGPTGPAIVPGTSRPITFGGQPSVVVPPGTDYLYSDAVEFPVEALQHVAVSLYLPDATSPDAGESYNTSYATAAGAGDRTEEEDGHTFGISLTRTLALTAIDVLTTEANGAVVGLGSASMAGTGTDRDTYRRFIDQLAVRVNDNVAPGQRKALLGVGIGAEPLHDSLNRYDRDVLSQSGVTGVILFSINDLALGLRNAQQVVADYRIAIARAHARGVRTFCPTWPPASHTFVFSGATQELSKLNAWILNSGECDDVVDWYSVLADDLVPYTYRATYQFDSIHFNEAGHTAVTDATPLRWFTAPPLPKD